MNYFLMFLFVLGLCEFPVKAVPITEQIYFYHYSNKEQINGTELKIGEALWNINPKLPWKFFIHGWTTSPTISPWFQEGKEAYFTKGKYNIVFVDWSIPANQTYVQSVNNARGSGEFVGKFILHLVDNGVALENVHLLGHSLGSHMSGYCGKFIYNATESNEKIGRITGLDPAGPIYELNPLALTNANNNLIKAILLPSNLRLDQNDACFVDVIHTDSGRYGIQSNIGHIDFYPNGGRRVQPGCETTNDDNCSHARSTKFFFESINNNNFIARECPNFQAYQNGRCETNKFAKMGEYTDVKARGIFYLATNSEPPYAKGNEKWSFSDARNSHEITSTINFCNRIFVVFTVFYMIQIY